MYDGDLKEFSAIAFEDGKVVEVYSDTTFENDTDAEVIDGEDRVMLPGLIDRPCNGSGISGDECEFGRHRVN